MSDPTLYIFSGLPASGKTTLAERLARAVGAVFLRIDTFEQGLRDLLSVEPEGEGYRLAYRIAADNLRLGSSVVADSCNPITLTRDEWEDVARASGAAFVNVEVICSDPAVHRGRVENRESTVPGLVLPTWAEITARRYDPWDRPRHVIDTAHRDVGKCLDELMRKLDSLG
ncbi:MAG: AAA family ATPase [Chitinivibrionales bacterium]|nr:AAA family ATPase [Chitinivibrionales bacterium]